MSKMDFFFSRIEMKKTEEDSFKSNEWESKMSLTVETVMEDVTSPYVWFDCKTLFNCSKCINKHFYN